MHSDILLLVGLRRLLVARYVYVPSSILSPFDLAEEQAEEV